MPETTWASGGDSNVSKWWRKHGSWPSWPVRQLPSLLSEHSTGMWGRPTGCNVPRLGTQYPADKAHSSAHITGRGSPALVGRLTSCVSPEQHRLTIHSSAVTNSFLPPNLARSSVSALGLRREAASRGATESPNDGLLTLLATGFQELNHHHRWTVGGNNV